MNGMNDPHFFDLAMKVIANQATDAERAELDSAVGTDPQLKAELERLRAERRVFKEVLPLVEATEAKSGELPGHARARLQAKVRQTYGTAREPEQEGKRGPIEGWLLWVLGLAAASALLAVLLVPVLTKSPRPIVHVAMFDLVGATRGTNTVELETLRQMWKESRVESFSSTAGLDAWERNWPDQAKNPVIKVIYDRSAGEVRVTGHSKGQRFQKSFPVEPDLQAALKRAASFIEEQIGR
jgi:hypothetical protein